MDEKYKSIYKSITRNMFNVNKLVVKLSIRLLNEEEQSAMNDYEKKMSDSLSYRFLSLNYFPFIIIDSIDNKGNNWSRDKTIIISNKNFHVIMRGFKKMRDIMYSEDSLFYLSDNKVCMYQLEKRFIVEVFNAGSKNYLLLHPCIYEDADGLTYEGVRIFINNQSNFIDLPIDDFDCLYDNLKNIDLFLYSQALLNFYIAYAHKVELPERTFKPKKNLFSQPAVKESIVESVGLTKNEDDPFKGL